MWTERVAEIGRDGPEVAPGCAEVAPRLGVALGCTWRWRACRRAAGPQGRRAAGRVGRRSVCHCWAACITSYRLAGARSARTWRGSGRAPSTSSSCRRRVPPCKEASTPAGQSASSPRGARRRCRKTAGGGPRPHRLDGCGLNPGAHRRELLSLLPGCHLRYRTPRARGAMPNVTSGPLVPPPACAQNVLHGQAAPYRVRCISFSLPTSVF